MKKPTLEQLGDVLAAIEAREWNERLYLDAARPWTQETRCAVLNFDQDEDEDDDIPAFATQNGLRDNLLITDVQDIVSNARQQRSDVDVNDLITALNFYYDNDAFVVW